MEPAKRGKIRDDAKIQPVNEAALGPLPTASQGEDTGEEEEEETPRRRRSERNARSLQAVTVGTTTPSSAQVAMEQQEYVVDKIVTHREEGDGTFSYLVKWYWYSEDQNTWEPITNLRRSMIERYYLRRQIQCPEDLDLAMEG